MKWPIVHLADVARITGGSTPRRDRDGYWNGDIPWLTPTDLPAPGEAIADVTDTQSCITREGLASCSASLLPAGTVLFSSRATIGKLGIARVPLATNQGFANFIPNETVAARYLAYCLMYHTDQIKMLAGSTTFKEVSKRELRRFRIPLPPPAEQRRIVEILDQADRLRKLRTEADAKAERILPALFYKMFGNPETNPRGWPQRPLGGMATITTGNTPSRKVPEYYGNHIEWAKSDNINTPSHYLTPAREFLSRRGLDAGRSAEPGSVLMTCIAGSPSCIGNAALANRRVSFNQQINALTPKADVDPLFLYAHCLVGKRLVQAASTGGMKGLVSKTRLSGVRFLCPPFDRQKHFGGLARQMIDVDESRIQVRQKLDRLSTTLRYHAFTGNLTTSWREAHMEELLAEMEAQARLLDNEEIE